MSAVSSEIVNVALTRPASVMLAKSESANASPSGRAGCPCPSFVSVAVTSAAVNVSAVPSYCLLFVGDVSVTARGVILTVPFAVVIT